MPPDSRSARRARNGVSWVMSSSRSRAASKRLHAVDLGEEGDVLVDGQVAVEAEALRQVADLAGDGAMLGDGIAAEHADAPGVGREQPAGQADGGRLARAVGTDQAEHLAGARRRTTARSIAVTAP